MNKKIRIKTFRGQESSLYRSDSYSFEDSFNKWVDKQDGINFCIKDTLQTSTYDHTQKIVINTLTIFYYE